MRKNDFHKLLIGVSLLFLFLTGCGMQAAENRESADISRQQETEENVSPDVPTEVISLDTLNPEQGGSDGVAGDLDENETGSDGAAGDLDGNETESDSAAGDFNGNEIESESAVGVLDENETGMETGSDGAAGDLDGNDNETDANASGIESSELSGTVSSEYTDANYQDASVWENAETYYSNYGYRITIPDEWKEKVSIVEKESGTDFICTPAEEENYTGLLFSLQKISEEEYNEKSSGSQMITKVAEEGGEVIAAVYPTEETYDEENSFAKESYETAAKYIRGVLGSCRLE